MKISVVTTCHNSEATIAWTIRSFLSQTYPHKEMLIIDGASTDRTLEIAKKFVSSDIRIVSEPDNGMYDAMNKGLRLYTGDAIRFLNSDDTFHDTDALDRIADGLKKADAVHSGVVFVKSHETKRIVRTWKGKSFKRGQFRWGWLPPHPTFYIRRSLAERTGEFDLSYASAADYDYMLRALELHAEIGGLCARAPGGFLGRGCEFGIKKRYSRQLWVPEISPQASWRTGPRPGIFFEAGAQNAITKSSQSKVMCCRTTLSALEKLSGDGLIMLPDTANHS